MKNIMKLVLLLSITTLVSACATTQPQNANKLQNNDAPLEQDSSTTKLRVWIAPDYARSLQSHDEPNPKYQYIDLKRR